MTESESYNSCFAGYWKYHNRLLQDTCFFRAMFFKTLHQNSIQGLLKHRLLGSIPGVSNSVALVLDLDRMQELAFLTISQRSWYQGPHFAATDHEIHLSQDGFPSWDLVLLHLCCSLWGLENGPKTVITTSTHDMPDAAVCFLSYVILHS